ncbi:MAG TPA: Holliday junction resolvase RuvX [Candidatus Saccharimonadales bacterium]|nr:Holliday junction resolvase RuvX [Candidatus Saccharimonadales bacterium]
MVNSGMIMALDVGERRTGIAMASAQARIAQPYATLSETININQDIADMINVQQVSLLIIGLPRNTNNDDTDQTLYVRRFTERLRQFTPVPIVFQDEAESTKRAEAELNKRRQPFQKTDVDALAAAYILQDYLNQQPPGVINAQSVV